MVDGTMTVGDIVEVSRFAEFDTNKSLYELLTRDLIEEVRGQSAAAVLEAAAPVDETEVAETPVPLPLVALLTIMVVASLGTSFGNPLNRFAPLGRPLSAIGATRKAISMERVQTIGRGIEKYHVVNGKLPEKLTDLAP